MYVEHTEGVGGEIFKAVCKLGLQGIVSKRLNAPYRSMGADGLRHFYASWYFNRRADGGLEVPPKAVRARLGQASIVMTLDRYSHLFPAHHDSAELAAAERALFAK